MTSGEETELVYSYNPGARTGQKILQMCTLKVNWLKMPVALFIWVTSSHEMTDLSTSVL